MRYRIRLQWISITTVLMLVMLTGMTSAAKTHLTVAPWAGMGDRNKGGQLEQLVAEYEALHPDIEIEVLERIPTYEFIPKLLLMPQMPDVLETHLGWFPELMQAGITTALPPDLESRAKRFFFSPVLQPFLHGGKLYGIPTEYELYALGYSTRIWANAGVSQPPKTWDELRLLATKATLRNANGTVARTGLRFCGADWAAGGECETLTYMALLWSNNGTYIDESGRPGFDQPEALETIDYLTDLVRSQVAQANAWYGLHNGTTFMSILPSWSRVVLQRAMGDDFSNIASTLIPHGKGDHATSQYGWGFIVPSRAKHPKEAWELLEWLTMRADANALTRTGLAMSQLGSIPTNQNDLRQRRELHTEAFWRGFLDGMDYAKPEPHFPQIFTRWKELGNVMQPVMRLQIPPTQGLADAQVRISALLATSRK